MDAEHIKDVLKHHWVAIAGGCVGVYVLLHYGSGLFGGSRAAPVADNSALIGSMIQASAASTANNQQYQLSQAALANTATAQANAAQVAQTAAVGNVISEVGNSIGAVIQAQSLLPATAMNDATKGHQTALSSAAGVAAAGVASLPGTIQASSELLANSFAPVDSFSAYLTGLSANVANMGASAFNAVAGIGTGVASSAAHAGAAAAAANAQVSAAEAKAIGDTASTAMMAFA